MSKITPDRLAEIEARERAATPGPWKWSESEGDCGVYHEACPRELECSDDLCQTCEHWEILQGAWLDGPEFVECGDDCYFTDKDAEFIAHARTDIPDLIAEVERLRAELDAAKRDLAIVPTICFGGCSGDPSVGVPDCPFFDWVDGDKVGYREAARRCRYAENGGVE